VLNANKGLGGEGDFFFGGGFVELDGGFEGPFLGWVLDAVFFDFYVPAVFEGEGWFFPGGEVFVVADFVVCKEKVVGGDGGEEGDVEGVKFVVDDFDVSVVRLGLFV